MKKILGLDVGTNSIGWALVQEAESNEKSKILGIGSRIIPIDTQFLQKWSSGVASGETPNANRRGYRGGRRLIQRYKLRRERLIEVSKMLELIPEDYSIGKTKIAEVCIKLKVDRLGVNILPIFEDDGIKDKIQKD